MYEKMFQISPQQTSQSAFEDHRRSSVVSVDQLSIVSEQNLYSPQLIPQTPLSSSTATSQRSSLDATAYSAFFFKSQQPSMPLTFPMKNYVVQQTNSSPADLNPPLNFQSNQILPTTSVFDVKDSKSERQKRKSGVQLCDELAGQSFTTASSLLHQTTSIKTSNNSSVASQQQASSRISKNESTEFKQWLDQNPNVNQHLNQSTNKLLELLAAPQSGSYVPPIPLPSFNEMIGHLYWMSIFILGMISNLKLPLEILMNYKPEALTGLQHMMSSHPKEESLQTLKTQQELLLMHLNRECARSQQTNEPTKSRPKQHYRSENAKKNKKCGREESKRRFLSTSTHRPVSSLLNKICRSSTSSFRHQNLMAAIAERQSRMHSKWLETRDAQNEQETNLENENSRFSHESLRLQKLREQQIADFQQLPEYIQRQILDIQMHSLLAHESSAHLLPTTVRHDQESNLLSMLQQEQFASQFHQSPCKPNGLKVSGERIIRELLAAHWQRMHQQQNENQSPEVVCPDSMPGPSNFKPLHVFSTETPTTETFQSAETDANCSTPPPKIDSVVNEPQNKVDIQLENGDHLRDLPVISPQEDPMEISLHTQNERFTRLQTTPTVTVESTQATPSFSVDSLISVPRSSFQQSTQDLNSTANSTFAYFNFFPTTSTFYPPPLDLFKVLTETTDVQVSSKT
ncbi:hypothetical protein M3Y96_00394200 [Aphelenchoides besseyi]|nr:hypothetical protein M3Y96_00394200 [Aphelenchoides besseyi]